MIKTKKSNSRWSQEDDDLLIALVKKGQCAKEIAKVLGRTRSAIWSRKHILGHSEIRIKPAKGDLREIRTASNTIIQVSNPFSFIMDIPLNLIPGFIGYKGLHISRIQEKLGVKLRIQEDDTLLIRGSSLEKIEEAVEYIRELIREPEIGSIYMGEVTSILNYGAFISLNPLYQGLCHSSEILGHPIDNVADHLSVGQKVKVKVIAKVNNRLSLSIAAAQTVPEITSVQTIETDPDIIQVMSPREITAEMTKLARQLARSNGQRMVLAIYYVEANTESK